MSAAEGIDPDDDVLGVAPEPAGSLTLGELEEAVRNLPSAVVRDMLAARVKADPVVAAGVLWPSEDNARRQVGSLLEFDRLREREQALEAMALYRASQAKTVYPVSLADVAADLAAGRIERPKPSVGGLLYPGRVNAVYGSHTAGKTWLALHLASVNADAGGRTLVLDYEDSAEGIAARCLALGGDLAESVVYLAPDGPLNPASLARIVEAEGITLVVLDSVGESLAAGGYDSNSERDVTQWFTQVPDALAALGPAVLIIDHIAKKQDGTPSPVGSFRKSAAITGAQFALENKEGFSREREGYSRLTCTKDRNGYFATGETVGLVRFKPHDGFMDLTFTRGEDVPAPVYTERRKGILGYVSERWALRGTTDPNGKTIDGYSRITGIRESVRGTHDAVREDLDYLVREGLLLAEATAYNGRDAYMYRPAPAPFEVYPESEDG